MPSLFFYPFITSTFIAFVITYPVIRLAWHFGLIDDPRRHKHPKVIHTQPIPRGGGLAIFISLFFSSLIFLPIDKHLKGILVGATIITTMGLLDDWLLAKKIEFSPYLRLIIQFFAASMPIIAGIGIAFWQTPFGNILDLSHPQIHFTLFNQERSLWILSDIFALFWIVTIMNFLNWGAKGVDGQLSGVVVIAALTIAALSIRFSADITEWPVIILAAITAGSFFGFLPWHLYPQRIMPSFSGSNLGGYLLAILSILTTAKVGTLALVLGVPLIDSGYTLIRRITSGQSPIWGDRGHLHHRLLDAGLTKRQVTYFYWAVTTLLGFLALHLNAQNKFYTIIGVSLLLGGLILWLTYHPKQS
jgi:UDP-GlcNAc:undecaprenyl-phosphate GlcNAc-1-phosphate transferase